MAHQKPTRSIKELLDHQFPAEAFSPEDRLRALLFHLRASALSEPELTWETMRLLEVPWEVVEPLLSGDMHTLQAQLFVEGGWPTLAALLSSRLGLSAGADLLEVAKAEYDQMSLAERRWTLVSNEGLFRRGYQTQQMRHQQVRQTSLQLSANPLAVGTFAELVQALRLLRAGKNNPPWRQMAQHSEELLPGWDPYTHEARSHTALRRVLQPGGQPSLPAVLAFVRGCGVHSHKEGKAWTQAHARATLYAELDAAMPSEPDQVEVDQVVRGWTLDSPSGPNPSMR